MPRGHHRPPPLRLGQWDLLLQSQQVGFRLKQLPVAGALRPVERALGARHPMRALVETLIGAQAMAEILKAPTLTLGGRPADDPIAIDEYVDGSHVAGEVARICVRLRKPGGGNPSVALRALRRAVAQSRLQLEEGKGSFELKSSVAMVARARWLVMAPRASHSEARPSGRWQGSASALRNASPIGRPRQAKRK
jgi:hypothetical protein